METHVEPTTAPEEQPERRLIEVKNVDGDAHDVGGARVVPGQQATVDADDPNVASLLAAELLREVPPVAQEPDPTSLHAPELVEFIKTATAEQLDHIEQAEQERDPERVTVTRAIAHRRGELAAAPTEGAPS